MRELKNGRVKIKFDELHIGMILYHEFAVTESHLDHNDFILVTGKHKSGDRRWFCGLKSKNPNRFSIPESFESKEAMYVDHFGWQFLQKMYLINPEKLKGVNWDDENISYSHNIRDFIHLSVYHS